MAKYFDGKTYVILTPDDLLPRLPRREVWYSKEIAKAFGVSSRTVQYAAKRKGIGTKVKHSKNGCLLFTKADFPMLCKHIHGVAGNPLIRAKKNVKTDAANNQDCTDRITDGS